MKVEIKPSWLTPGFGYQVCHFPSPWRHNMERFCISGSLWGEFIALMEWLLNMLTVTCNPATVQCPPKWNWELTTFISYDNVIKWKHFPRHCLFLRGIHRSPVDSPHKGQWRGVLMFSLIGTWTNSWANNRDAGDLRRHRAHYDLILMSHRILVVCIIKVVNYLSGLLLIIIQEVSAKTCSRMPL